MGGDEGVGREEDVGGTSTWAGTRAWAAAGEVSSGPCVLGLRRVAFEDMGDKYASLRRAQLHLDFIHANSTTHSFLFGALAELLDNARDAGAARLDVFSVDNENLQGGFMLCFLDDGCGMSPEEASDIIYFGTSKKRSSTLKFIGQYGNGLKSGSMRIGKDFILFTKKEETMTCVFFSQTFCEREGLTEVVVPIPSWLTRTRKSVTDDPQKFSTELSIIFKYSPFRNEAELMQQFDLIYGKCGTLLVVYNLKLLLSGEPELDVKTDKEDILMAGALEDFPERWSFRAYTSVLYFEPWMRIFIQAKRVKTKHLCYCLYKPRKYLYVTSSFKGAFKNEVKKAEEAVKIAELVLKEAQITVNWPDRTSLSCAKDVLQKALEDVEAKHKILKEKQRELKKARTLCLFFGVNIENRSQAGMFIYSNNRLIKMHEKVGPQLKLKSLLGAGVVGIVNIPLEIMEPSHNKQEFLNVQEYNHLLRVMGQYLVQYCKDTGISNRNLTLFWNEFGYQNDKDMEKSLDSVQYQRRQAMAIPFIIQCDLCLKWRILPSSITYQEKEFFDLWICANNPNPLENSCHQAERLPSIPLGTMSSVSPSKTEKEKQLREAIQRYHSRLADLQPQPQFIPTSRITEFTTTCQTSASKENTKTQKVRPWGDNLKQESLASFELSVSHRGWKRNPEGTDSDVECIAEDKIMKKSPQKKAKPQQHRRLAALPENVSLGQRSQASSWEMNRKQSQNLVQECQALIEVETSNGDYPDIILVLDKSDTEVSLKQEKKEEPCGDTPEIKRNSSLSNRESAPMEDLSPRSGHNTSFSVSGHCHVAALLRESSQSTSVKETVRKLASNLREILRYFFPKYQLLSEVGYTSVEELAASFELEQCPEQTNKKLRMCFNQIQNVYMAQYERELKRKMQSMIYDANQRGVVNEISLGQCEEKRKITEDKLNNLRVKLAALLQKLQLGSPAGDQEQIDRYLEALLKEDNPLFRNALNKVTTDVGHGLPLEKSGK
uniref:MORC family CW-type zinc finger protein 1 n=1 Tax=Odobenus rosmarus divergens TaxID=9708 RepID=UPI00063C4CEA|nr:PREDICTED: MORC family CW-type zinc finger protein 1 [Odobenus rosmarus divergens]